MNRTCLVLLVSVGLFGSSAVKPAQLASFHEAKKVAKKLMVQESVDRGCTLESSKKAAKRASPSQLNCYIANNLEAVQEGLEHRRKKPHKQQDRLIVRGLRKLKIGDGEDVAIARASYNLAVQLETLPGVWLCASGTDSE